MIIGESFMFFAAMLSATMGIGMVAKGVQADLKGQTWPAEFAYAFAAFLFTVAFIVVRLWMG